MATITPRKNKKGEIISYQIQVYRGRSTNGKKLKPFIKTWKVPEGLTEKKIQKELNRVATLFEESCHNGTVSTEKQTFEEYAKYVIDLKEKSGIKYKTIEAYRKILKRITDVNNSGIGHLKLQDIRPDHLNNLYITLAQNKQNNRTGGGLSANTILAHHRFISAVFSQAVKEQLLQYNTAQRATPPKATKHEAECFEIEDIQAIIKAVSHKPLKWQVLTHLFIVTGARRGEILGLQWKSVDFDNNQIYLCNNLLYSTEKGIYSTTLKTGENRYVNIPPYVIDMLKQWKQKQSEIACALGDKWIETNYVFTQTNGKPFFPDSIWGFFKRLEKKYNLPSINPHKFRHSQASILINQGIDIVTVSKRLGHSKTSTTSDIYAHMLRKSDERACNVINDVLNFEQ